MYKKGDDRCRSVGARKSGEDRATWKLQIGTLKLGEFEDGEADEGGDADADGKGDDGVNGFQVIGDGSLSPLLYFQAGCDMFGDNLLVRP